jgi:hypothetical protein
MMIGGAQVRFGQIAKSFVLRNLFSIVLLAIAFASTVASGAFVSARFVARSIERVTRLALAIEPTAPQASISLDESRSNSGRWSARLTAPSMRLTPTSNGNADSSAMRPINSARR